MSEERDPLLRLYHLGQALNLEEARAILKAISEGGFGYSNDATVGRLQADLSIVIEAKASAAAKREGGS